MLDLPAADFDLLARYYNAEPWGAWRENMHAAMIAREIRATRSRKVPQLEEFMLMLPEKRKKGHLTGLVETLKAMAGGKRIHISEWKPPKRGKRGSGKTGSKARSAVRAAAGRTRQS